MKAEYETASELSTDTTTNDLGWPWTVLDISQNCTSNILNATRDTMLDRTEVIYETTVGFQLAQWPRPWMTLNCPSSRSSKLYGIGSLTQACTGSQIGYLFTMHIILYCIVSHMDIWKQPFTQRHWEAIMTTVSFPSQIFIIYLHSYFNIKNNHKISITLSFFDIVSCDVNAFLPLFW